MTTHDACAFCAQIAGSSIGNLLHELLGTRWATRPLLRDDTHAVAMPSIGALTPGHVLISPKRHRRSFAEAPAGERTALEGLAAAVAALLQERTEHPVHAFEHGSSLEGDRVACSVEHAHRHLIPLAVGRSLDLAGLADWRELDGPDALQPATAGLEYLCYEEPGGRMWVATTQTGFPSQLLRRAFARALGAGELWDWRAHPACETVRETIGLFDAPAAAPAAGFALAGAGGR